MSREADYCTFVVRMADPTMVIFGETSPCTLAARTADPTMLSMPNYRRARFAGGMYFFTLVTARRRRILIANEARQMLRNAITECRKDLPFAIVAMVLLPDHLHTIWRLPRGDSDYSKRWSIIKRTFSQAWVGAGGEVAHVSTSQRRHGRLGVWQRRFWEHALHDENDLTRHLDYIHFNPVKHGLVACPHLWPHSTFRRFVRQGAYAENWCCRCGRASIEVENSLWELETSGE